jgi:hypothetical protein
MQRPGLRVKIADLKWLSPAKNSIAGSFSLRVRQVPLVLGRANAKCHLGLDPIDWRTFTLSGCKPPPKPEPTSYCGNRLSQSSAMTFFS